jgi:signal peptidase S26 family
LSESTEISLRAGAERAALLREALFEKGRRLVVTVASGSMEPTLHAGDRIVVEGTSPSRLRRGDIVVFESPVAGLVVHRLMWQVPPVGEPRAIFTKGDALPHCDRPVAVQGIVGRVVEVQSGRTRRRLLRTVGYARWAAAAVSWGWRRGIGLIARKALGFGKLR